MSLSKIPVEVVEGSIFKYLAWNDLLSLREVSKAHWTIVQGYMNTEKGTERGPEVSLGLSITEDYTNLKTFIELNIPTTRIYFRNRNSYQSGEDESALQNEEIKAFVEEYGGKVKHLRLQKFSMYLEDADTAQLLKGLPNLESLSVDELLIARPTREHRPILPEIVFQNLKALDLHVKSDELMDAEAHECLTIWLIECGSLQKLRLSMKSQTLFLIVRDVLEALISAVDTGNGWESIEFDVYSTWVEFGDRTVFKRLLATCAAKNVAVAGVHATWLRDHIGFRVLPTTPRISSSITKIRVGNRAPDLGHMQLDKLTTLEITSASAFMKMDIEGPEGPWWSATLKSLEAVPEEK